MSTHIILALITSIAAIIGGLIPLHKKIKGLDFRYLIGFASGAMVAIAFFDMIPEIGSAHILALGLGFFVVYAIEKIAMIHACGEWECEIHTFGWTALIGISIESLIDGIAIGLGYVLSPTLGITIALAVFIHEIPRGFATTVIMKNANKGMTAILTALAIDAGFTPIGAIFSSFFPQEMIFNLLAFAAGTFIYVGASDLLPNAHQRFNLWVVLSVLFGAAVIFLAG